MKKLPNIHLLETNLNYYLFSVSTNSIVQIQEKLFRYLYYITNNIEDTLNQYDEDTKKGFVFLEQESYLEPVEL